MFKGLLRQASLAAVLCIGLCSMLWADESPRVYSGTLGKMPIVLMLDSSNDNEVSGRYFYQKHHLDLALNGRRDGQLISLIEGEERGGNGKALPHLRLHETASGLQGQWQSPEGKQLEVELRPVRLPSLPSDALPYLATLYTRAPYEYLRLQGLPLQAGKKQVFMGYTLQWWREPQSNISLFEVVEGYPAEQRTRINQQLMERLWRDVGRYHECRLNGGEAAVYQQQARPKLLTPALLSVSISRGWDCGGPHPDEIEAGFNLQVDSAQELTLEDLLWLGEGRAFRYVRDENGWGEDESDVDSSGFADYRRQRLAPWLISQFQARHPQGLSPSTIDQEGCDYGNVERWVYVNWYLGADGLHVLPAFSHSEGGCRAPAWSVLPYSLVRQHPGRLPLPLP